MPTRNYYIVLGIPESESADGVRRAFRDLVRRYHPDRAGPTSTPVFQEIVDAYHTLSDPARRASYDAGLRVGDSRSPPVVPRPWPDVPGEPLVPLRDSLRRDYHATRPSRDDVLGRIRRNFSAEPRPRAGRMQALGLQLLISREDAFHGGVLGLGVPVYDPCSTCRGSGRVAGITCHPCAGAGMRETEETVRLRLPPGVRDGDTFDLNLRGLGIHNLYLEVRVRVAH